MTNNGEFWIIGRDIADSREFLLVIAKVANEFSEDSSMPLLESIGSSLKSPTALSQIPIFVPEKASLLVFTSLAILVPAPQFPRPLCQPIQNAYP